MKNQFQNARKPLTKATASSRPEQAYKNIPLTYEELNKSHFTVDQYANIAGVAMEFLIETERYSQLCKYMLDILKNHANELPANDMRAIHWNLLQGYAKAPDIAKPSLNRFLEGQLRFLNFNDTGALLYAIKEKLPGHQAPPSLIRK